LDWQRNSAAVGFNIYRRNTAGSYQRLNSQPVSGASFVDHGLDLPGHRLGAATSYDYEVRAIDAQGMESGPSSISAATAAEPPACDPYFSDNVTHVNLLRAYLGFTAGGITVEAVGSGDVMGRYSADVFTQLIKIGPKFYRRYCP